MFLSILRCVVLPRAPPRAPPVAPVLPRAPMNNVDKLGLVFFFQSFSQHCYWGKGVLFVIVSTMFAPDCSNSRAARRPKCTFTYANVGQFHFAHKKLHIRHLSGYLDF